MFYESVIKLYESLSILDRSFRHSFCQIYEPRHLFLHSKIKLHETVLENTFVTTYLLISVFSSCGTFLSIYIYIYIHIYIYIYIYVRL